MKLTEREKEIIINCLEQRIHEQRINLNRSLGSKYEDEARKALTEYQLVLIRLRHI